jgi:hypothetical protein
MIINASHGIIFNYTTGSGGGTHVNMRDVIVSAFVVRLRTTCVNDTMYWSNIHCRNLWYNSNSVVVAYIRAHTVGWQCGYTDNIMVDGIEFFEDRGIRFVDETCLGATHSMYNATLNNVQFNLPQICMAVADSHTTVNGMFSNVVAQAGNAFGYTWSDTMFQLGSNNVYVTLNNVRINQAGGVIALIGNGVDTGGKLTVTGLDVANYSSAASGQNGFSLANGTLTLKNVLRFVKSDGEGSYISGAGTVNMNVSERVIFSTFGELGSVFCDGTWQSASTDSEITGSGGELQGRLYGFIYVTTLPGGGSGTIDIRMSGHNEITATQTVTSTGWQSAIDSNWIDIPSDNNTLGRLEIRGTNGVVLGATQFSLLLR